MSEHLKRQRWRGVRRRGCGHAKAPGKWERRQVRKSEKGGNVESCNESKRGDKWGDPWKQAAENPNCGSIWVKIWTGFRWVEELIPNKEKKKQEGRLTWVNEWRTARRNQWLRGGAEGGVLFAGDVRLHQVVAPELKECERERESKGEKQWNWKWERNDKSEARLEIRIAKGNTLIDR